MIMTWMDCAALATSAVTNKKDAIVYHSNSAESLESFLN